MEIETIKRKIEDNLKTAKRNVNLNLEINTTISKITLAGFREYIISMGIRYKQFLAGNQTIYKLAKKIYKWLLQGRTQGILFQRDKYITKRDISNILIYNGEEFIRNVYLFILQREPDPDGMNYYSKFLQKYGEKGKKKIIKAMIFSEEAFNKGIKTKMFLFERLLWKFKIFIKLLLSITRLDKRGHKFFE